MPEGDTIFRAATTLRRALEGARVSSFRSTVLRENLAGLRIERVEARGKNLLVHFGDGRVLRTHMRMSGSWHIYREGEPWQRPAWQAKVELHADNGFVAVLFNAPVIELLDAAALEEGEVGRLGPDATADAFDPALARARLQALGPMSIGEALLHQGAMAGVGNVIKAETLFLCRQDPFAAVEALEQAQLEKLIAESRRLLLRNRSGAGMRTSRESLDGGRLWVYGRSGKPCRVCGTPVKMRRQGAAARSTYYCPSCQAGQPDAQVNPATPRR